MAILDFILLVFLAVFIFSRFFGYKLPKQKPTLFDDINKRQNAGKGAAQRQVVDFPKSPEASLKDITPTPSYDEEEEEDYAQPEQPEQQKLSGIAALKKADPSFKEKDFIDGAKQAFGLYYTAVAQKDMDTLEALLSPPLFAEISEKIENGVEHFTVAKPPKAEIVDVKLHGRTALVDVKYTAELDTPTKKQQHTSVWTWVKPITTDDPNWELDKITPLA